MKAIGKAVTFQERKEEDETFMLPFGPLIYYYKMPKNLVASLNTYADNISKNAIKSKSLDHSNQLVGKVKQEFLIEDKELKKHMPIFNRLVGKFIETDLSRHGQQLPSDIVITTNYRTAWIVRQFAGEFNPAHVHTECQMSCVGYLKLPSSIEKEWEEDYKDHHPCKGHIEFLHGQGTHLSKNTALIKPSVGDFFLFPAELIHMVYPFESKGERRSFSMNIEISQRKKLSSLDKDSPFQYFHKGDIKAKEVGTKTKIFKKDEHNV